MKKVLSFVLCTVAALTAAIVREYIAVVRQAETLTKKAKAIRGLLIDAAESGKLAELFPHDGNTYTVYSDSKLRNTITYIPPTETEVVDMEAVREHYKEIGKPVPTKKQTRSASLRIN